MTTTFQFIGNEAGEEEGLNHSGIETFRNSLFESLARECGQNSLDACLAKPVRLNIVLNEVPWKLFPGGEVLADAIASCAATVASQPGKNREREFFERAVGIINGTTVPVLEISDSNTRGLEGPALAGRPFHSLVKADGVSSKSDDGAGGSFGIGKYAAYAASGLRTVFYSTCYQTTDGTVQFLAQGKALLMSHARSQGKFRRTGYWGASGYEPVSNPTQVPRWLQRSEVGTSLFVTGFISESGWDSRMRAAVAQNFLWAIQRGDLEVTIRGSAAATPLEINSATLASCFIDPEVLACVEACNATDSFDFAKCLHRATEEGAIRERFEVDGLGTVQMSLLVAEGMPKRVMIVRNGLAITDSLAKFGDRLARFAGYREFVASFEPLDAMGRALLRDLENPQHNELSDERITDDKRRRAAIKTMKAFIREIRARLQKHAAVEVSDRVVLDEMSEFFADSDASAIRRKGGNELDPETQVVKGLKHKIHRPKVAATASTGGAEGGGAPPATDTSTTGPGTKPGPDTGGGTGGKGKRTSHGEVSLDLVRNVPLGPSSRRVYFTPLESGRGLLRVAAAGLAYEATLRVTSASSGIVKSGSVRMEVTADVRMTVDLAFDVPCDGPIVVRFLQESDSEDQ